MRTLLCLGNPGDEYANTRHNAGFLAADALAARERGVWLRRPDYLLAEFAPAGDRPAFRMVKPLMWMNRSGLVLPQLGGVFGPEDLLVVADEVNLPLGRIRLRAEGSAGGHNGLASVEAALGRRDYHRLRIGVGTGEPVAGAVLIDFVLGQFAGTEAPLVAATVGLAAQAMRCWAEQGIGEAQSRFNGQTAQAGADGPAVGE